ncbi:MAG: endonuclease/exonuclease/phosphatase family protein [Nitrospirota bacterium]
MTYNVHSCTGTDGRTDPHRIARVIESQAPDIIALQELDSGLARTGLADQALVLAEWLKMDYHFHPSIHMEAGQYGNAVLSPHPIRVVRAGELPTLPRRGVKEKRGAIWIKMDFGGREVQVLDTHLGLNRHERLAQATALAGPDWLGNPECGCPVVFCGDINVTGWSEVYRMFGRSLLDTHGRWGRATWPSRFPVLRLDYIFASHDVSVRDAFVPRERSVRRASDHLPVVSVLEIPDEEAQP